MIRKGIGLADGKWNDDHKSNLSLFSAHSECGTEVNVNINVNGFECKVIAKGNTDLISNQ